MFGECLKLPAPSSDAADGVTVEFVLVTAKETRRLFAEMLGVKT
jgi:hypothetical protein